MRTTIQSVIAIRILPNDKFCVVNEHIVANSYNRNTCKVTINDMIFYGSKAVVISNVIYIYP